jgi:hypothetical protein
LFVEDVVRVFPKLLHIGTDKHLTELDEVTMFFIVHLDNTPRVRPTTNFTAVGCANKLVRANNSERHAGSDFLHFRDTLLIFILILRQLEDVDVVMSDVRKHLSSVVKFWPAILNAQTTLTRALKSRSSSSVMVSALAITGIRLTFSCRRRINSMSTCFKLWCHDQINSFLLRTSTYACPVGWMK